MPLDGTEINKPALHPLWKTAKETAEKAAAKDKDDAQRFKALEKEFKKDLGPDLDNLFKAWPNLAKITTARLELDKTIKAYTKATKESKLSAPIAKTLTDALTKISTSLDERMEKAELELATDSYDEQLKQAMKESLTTTPKPIVIFRGDDIAKPAASLARNFSAKYDIERIEIEIVLSDPKVLSAAPSDEKDYSLLAQKMFDAASKKTIIEEFSKVLEKLAANPKLDAKEIDKLGNEELETILNEAAERAGEVFTKLTKTKVSYRNYQIKKGATVVMLVAGIGASIAALATAPFSGGAHGIVAVAGLIKTARKLYVEVGKLAEEAEDTAAKLNKELGTLKAEYLKASKNEIGLQEVSKTLINSLWAEGVETISDCKTHSSELKQKIGGLDIESHKVSDKLDEALKEQRVATQELAKFEKSAKQTLSDKEVKRIEKLISLDEKLGVKIMDLINGVSNLVSRVEKTSKEFDRLHKEVLLLAAKEPTWALVGELVIKVAVSAGFLVGSSVGAPEGFELVKTAHEVMEHFTQAIESSDGAIEAVKDVAEIVKQHR